MRQNRLRISEEEKEECTNQQATIALNERALKTPKSEKSADANTPEVTPQKDQAEDDGNVGDKGGQSTQQSPYSSIYWSSKPAGKLFGFNHEEQDGIEVLSERIELLRKAVNTCDGFKSIVDHKNEILNNYHVFVIRNKAMFLLNAYKITLEKMGHRDKKKAETILGRKIVAPQLFNESMMLAHSTRSMPEQWRIGIYLFANRASSLIRIRTLQMD